MHFVAGVADAFRQDTPMQRDMEILRTLLLKLEQQEMDPGSIRGLSCHGEELAIEGIDGAAIGHHLEMMIDAGLIHVLDDRMSNGHEIYFQRISWQGHEFLAAIRDQEVWKQTKAAAKTGGVEALSAIWDIAKAVGKAELKRRTGLDI
jgi:DNA-binding transcriptional ArsR family regulator